MEFAPTATGARTAALHVASNDPNTNSFTIGLSGTGFTYSEGWRMNYFGSADNTGDGADMNDYDKDGLANLLELATGSDPKVSSNAPGTVTRNGDILEFAYNRSVGALNEGIIFNVEWSDDLSLPNWSTNGVTELVLSDDGTIQVVKASVATGDAGHRFLHLKVARP